MNVGIFSGNLGRDAELNSTAKDNVLNFSVGVNVGNKAAPETMWISCALWGKRAETLKPYLVKGMKVTVTGACKLRTYQKKDGSQGTELSLNVQDLDLHGSGEKAAARPAGEAAKADGYQPQPKAAGTPAADFDQFDEDIPF
jgi:single-strand DNA-binding protein